MVFPGRINPTTFALGAALLFFGAFVGPALMLTTSIVTTGAIAAAICSPLGVMILLGAVKGRSKRATLDEVGFDVDGQCVAWSSLERAHERVEDRGGYRVIKTLTVVGGGRSAAVTNETWRPDDYAKMRALVEARAPIEVQAVRVG